MISITPPARRFDNTRAFPAAPLITSRLGCKAQSRITCATLSGSYTGGMGLAV
jgi:hypothetical protein